MAISRKDFLKILTVKTEEIEVESLGGAKVLIKELTIAETKEFNNIARDTTKKQNEAAYYACKCCMVEPAYFTDEELKTLNKEAEAVIMEIYSKIPLIGKTKEEKEKYYKMIEKIMSNETKEETKEESKETKEKK